MSCPYLSEVTMSFCRAFPVKKLVPTGRVITASRCDGECFGECPVYLEARARLNGTACDLEGASHSSANKGGRS